MGLLPVGRAGCRGGGWGGEPSQDALWQRSPGVSSAPGQLSHAEPTRTQPLPRCRPVPGSSRAVGSGRAGRGRHCGPSPAPRCGCRAGVGPARGKGRGGQPPKPRRSSPDLPLPAPPACLPTLPACLLPAVPLPACPLLACPFPPSPALARTQRAGTALETGVASSTMESARPGPHQRGVRPPEPRAGPPRRGTGAGGSFSVTARLPSPVRRSSPSALTCASVSRFSPFSFRNKLLSLQASRHNHV